MGLVNRAFRNVFRKKTRTLLVVLVLAFSIAAIMSVQMGIEESKINTQDMIDYTIANTTAMMDMYEQYLYEVENMTDIQLRQITVMNMSFGSEGGPGTGGGSRPARGPISGEVAHDISSVENVVDVLPVINERVGEDRRNPDYTVNGVLVDTELNEQYNLWPTFIVDGRTLKDGDYGVVIINTNLKDFFDCEVGDSILIDYMYFDVVGTYFSGSENNGIYMNISDARDLVGLDIDESQTLNVFAANSSVVDAVSYDIGEMYPDFMVSTYDDFSRFADRFRQTQETTIDDLWDETNGTVKQLEADMESIEDTGSQIIIISTITAGLMIMFLMLLAVKERVKEIGVLKALGFTGNNVMGQFVSEGTIISFFGGLLGIIFAIVAAPMLADILLPASEAFATSNPSIGLVFTVLALTVILGALGSLYPAWRASRKDPVEAMRNE